jgi:hypothetical protein
MILATPSRSNGNPNDLIALKPTKRRITPTHRGKNLNSVLVLIPAMLLNGYVTSSWPIGINRRTFGFLAISLLLVNQKRDFTKKSIKE